MIDHRHSCLPEPSAPQAACPVSARSLSLVLKQDFPGVQAGIYAAIHHTAAGACPVLFAHVRGHLPVLRMLAASALGILSFRCFTWLYLARAEWLKGLRPSKEQQVERTRNSGTRSPGAENAYRGTINR